MSKYKLYINKQKESAVPLNVTLTEEGESIAVRVNNKTVAALFIETGTPILSFNLFNTSQYIAPSIRKLESWVLGD